MKMNKFVKNTFFTWLALTFVIAFVSYMGGKDGGSPQYPVYLTKAQQEKPSLLFFELLPVAAIISAVMTAIGATIIYSLSKSK